MQIREVIFSELQTLPPEKVSEVLDFIRFLKVQEETAGILRATETSLRKLWDTPEEDEAWKNL